MKKLSFVLVLAMLLSLVPFTVSAAEEEVVWSAAPALPEQPASTAAVKTMSSMIRFFIIHLSCHNIVFSANVSYYKAV